MWFKDAAETYLYSLLSLCGLAVLVMVVILIGIKTFVMVIGIGTLLFSYIVGVAQFLSWLDKRVHAEKRE